MPVADTSSNTSDVIGKYQALASDKEIGDDGLPIEQPDETVSTLFFADGGKFTLTVDNEKFSGTYKVSEGKIVLTDPNDEHEIVLVVQEQGRKLIEESKEAPLVWLKVGQK